MSGLVKQANVLQVVGRLAEKRAATEQALQGLLVRHGAQDSIMHPADLPYFTKLHPGRVLQRQLLPLDKPFSEVLGSADRGLQLHLRLCSHRECKAAYKEHICASSVHAAFGLLHLTRAAALRLNVSALVERCLSCKSNATVCTVFQKLACVLVTIFDASRRTNLTHNKLFSNATP